MTVCNHYQLQTSAQCTYCGQPKHDEGSRCPAKDAVCHKCNRKGHFSKKNASPKQWQLGPMNWAWTQLSLGPREPNEVLHGQRHYSWKQGQYHVSSIPELKLLSRHTCSWASRSCWNLTKCSMGQWDRHWRSWESSLWWWNINKGRRSKQFSLSGVFKVTYLDFQRLPL